MFIKYMNFNTKFIVIVVNFKIIFFTGMRNYLLPYLTTRRSV